MPTYSEPASKTSLPPLYPPPQKTRRGTQSDVTSASVDTSPPPPPPPPSSPVIPSTSTIEFKYEPPKQERDDYEDDYDDDDDNFVEEDAHAYGTENIGLIANPYWMPYIYKRRYLDTLYGVLKEGDIFMIGESPIVVDTDGETTFKERVLKGSKGLWELLTRTKVNTEIITQDDQKT